MGRYRADGNRRGGLPRSLYCANRAELERNFWWTHLDSNQGPLACEASALTGLSYASTGKRIIAPAASCRKTQPLAVVRMIAVRHGRSERASDEPSARARCVLRAALTAPRHSQHALGDDVALNLRRPRLDRVRARAQKMMLPA